MPSRNLRLSAVCAFMLLLGSAGNSSISDSGEITEQRQLSDSLNRIVSALESNGNQSSEDLGCPPEREDRQSDLCAQWKAADAASASAFWSAASFWISLGASLVGALTLGAAWLAAKYARAAAEQGKRSADAAVNALDHAKGTSKTELRPYVYPNKPRHGQIDEDRTFVEMPIKNFGQTPALKVKIAFAACHAHMPIDFDHPDLLTLPEVPPDSEFGDIAPGQEVYVSLEVNGRKDFSHRILSSEYSLLFWGYIEYQDRNGEPHVTKFSFFSAGRNWISGSFGSTHVGNSAT